MKFSLLLQILCAGLAGILLLAAAMGAVHISPHNMWVALYNAIAGRPGENVYQNVFLQIRLPRVLLCAITGAALSGAGVLMQGLFRNPIVEPGLVGTSAGAAFGASLIFVLADVLPPALKSAAGDLLVPVFAFAGGLLATYLVYFLSKDVAKTSITALLLVGIAINALGLSGTGFMSYLARDPQARSITFWSLGTFAGAAWWQVIVTCIVGVIVFGFAMLHTRQLNALLLGDEEATYIGVQPQKLHRRILFLVTAIVSVATAFVGVISFMGLIVPHIVRLIVGSDHKKLLPASLLLGAILLTLADMAARLLLAPAEIPIGIITSFVGAPIFIFLLKRYSFSGNTGFIHD